MPSAKSKVFRENILTILTLIGVVSGGVLGTILRYTTSTWTPRELMYLAYPGEIFLRMLKCLIVPLLVSSITSAMASLDVSLSGKVAARSFLYYLLTTFLAVNLGIFLVITFEPGKGKADLNITTTDSPFNEPPRDVLTEDTLLDLIRNVVPTNVIQACSQSHQTQLEWNGKTPEGIITIICRIQKLLIFIYFSLGDLKLYTMKESLTNSTNVLGLVTFSIILGISIGMLKEKGKPLLNIFVAMSDAVMQITQWVIFVSPIGIFFLIAAKVKEFENILESMKMLGIYFIVVLLGLCIHTFITVSSLFLLACKELPYKYIGRMSRVLATAFGTGSSSATMPITINWLDDNGIDPRITRFVIPVGSTVNMDGTALYEAVAALFIAQFRGIEYTFGQIVAVSVTATAASIGAAAIPQAGLLTMVMVLQTLGLPADDYVLIIAVDWLLDRFRTTCNVTCDALAAIIIDRLSRKDLEALDRQEVI